MSDTSSTSEDYPPPSGAEHTPSSDTPADDKALAKDAEKLVIVDEKDVGMIPDFAWPLHLVSIYFGPLEYELLTDDSQGTLNSPRT